MRSPITRMGGKNLLKKRLVARFPKGYEEMTYVEPFVGSGALFYKKEPSAKEVINDLDSFVYQVHKGLQQYGAEIDGTLSRQYTKQDFERIRDSKPTTLKARCIKNLIMNRITFAGMGTHYAPTLSDPKLDYTQFEGRLKGVIILNQDYKNVVRRFDSSNTFFYFDPPYEESTSGHYKHHAFDLDAMVRLLHSIKGKFMVSMNDSPNVRRAFKGFHIGTIQTRYIMGANFRIVTEAIITNY